MCLKLCYCLDAVRMFGVGLPYVTISVVTVNAATALADLIHGWRLKSQRR